MEIESSLSAQPRPLDLARAKLKPPTKPDRTLAAVAAAALFAACALTFAAAAILAPPVTIAPIAKPGVQ
jgi:hypothetical protein